jgi:hypothetical protein
MVYSTLLSHKLPEGTKNLHELFYINIEQVTEITIEFNQVPTIKVQKLDLECNFHITQTSDKDKLRSMKLLGASKPAYSL